MKKNVYETTQTICGYKTTRASQKNVLHFRSQIAMLDKNFNTSIQMPMFTDSNEAILENEDFNGDLLIPTNFLIQHQRQQQTGFYLFCKLDYRIFQIILENVNCRQSMPIV